MSWELEHLTRRGWNHRAGSPIALIGFVLGLMAMSTSVFIYFWLLAWIAPLILVVLFVVASLLARKYTERLTYLADGALAAVAFGVVFAVVGAIALAN
jgi:CHASE2 domain-containing sensor protein